LTPRVGPPCMLPTSTLSPVAFFLFSFRFLGPMAGIAFFLCLKFLHPPRNPFSLPLFFRLHPPSRPVQVWLSQPISFLEIQVFFSANFPHFQSRCTLLFFSSPLVVGSVRQNCFFGDYLLPSSFFIPHPPLFFFFGTRLVGHNPPPFTTGFFGNLCLFPQPFPYNVFSLAQPPNGNFFLFGPSCAPPPLVFFNFPPYSSMAFHGTLLVVLPGLFDSVLPLSFSRSLSVLFQVAFPFC